MRRQRLPGSALHGHDESERQKQREPEEHACPDPAAPPSRARHVEEHRQGDQGVGRVAHGRGTDEHAGNRPGPQHRAALEVAAVDLIRSAVEARRRLAPPYQRTGKNDGGEDEDFALPAEDRGEGDRAEEKERHPDRRGRSERRAQRPARRDGRQYERQGIEQERSALAREKDRPAPQAGRQIGRFQSAAVRIGAHSARALPRRRRESGSASPSTKSASWSRARLCAASQFVDSAPGAGGRSGAAVAATQTVARQEDGEQQTAGALQTHRSHSQAPSGRCPSTICKVGLISRRAAASGRRSSRTKRRDAPGSSASGSESQRRPR